MAAGDLLRLGMHPSCEYPLNLGRDDLVLCADDIERRFVALSGLIDGGLERRVV